MRSFIRRLVLIFIVLTVSCLNCGNIEFVNTAHGQGFHNGTIEHCINTKWQDFNDRKHYTYIKTLKLGMKLYRFKTDEIMMEVYVLDGLIKIQSSSILLGAQTKQVLKEMDEWIMSRRPLRTSGDINSSKTYKFEDIEVLLANRSTAIQYMVSENDMSQSVVSAPPKTIQQKSDPSTEGVRGLEGLRGVDTVSTNQQPESYNARRLRHYLNTPISVDRGVAGLNDSRLDKNITTTSQLDDLTKTRTEYAQADMPTGMIVFITIVLIIMLVSICSYKEKPETIENVKSPSMDAHPHKKTPTTDLHSHITQIKKTNAMPSISNIWNAIHGWFKDTSERIRLVQSFNNSAREAFVTKSVPTVLKASVSRGDRKYKHQFSHFWYSGFRIKATSGRQLSKQELIEIGAVIINDGYLVRQLIVLGWDTLEVFGEGGNYGCKWQLRDYAMLPE